MLKHVIVTKPLSYPLLKILYPPLRGVIYSPNSRMLLSSVAMKRKMERWDLKAMDCFVKIEDGIDNEFI